MTRGQIFQYSLFSDRPVNQTLSIDVRWQESLSGEWSRVWVGGERQPNPVSGWSHGILLMCRVWPAGGFSYLTPALSIWMCSFPLYCYWNINVSTQPGKLCKGIMAKFPFSRLDFTAAYDSSHISPLSLWRTGASTNLWGKLLTTHRLSPSSVLSFS